MNLCQCCPSFRAVDQQSVNLGRVFVPGMYCIVCISCNAFRCRFYVFLVVGVGFVYTRWQ